jgi:tetratricopeptide (TPR) repeat protein
LYWAGNPPAARPAFEEAVKHDPELAAAWYYLGECDRLLGHPDAARTAFTRCLRIDPDFGRAHTALTLLPPLR